MIEQVDISQYDMIPIDQAVVESKEENESDIRINWYKDFLSKTDYIVLKLFSAQYFNKPASDYHEIMIAREEAREKINELRSQQEKSTNNRKEEEIINDNNSN